MMEARLRGGIWDGFFREVVDVALDIVEEQLCPIAADPVPDKDALNGGFLTVQRQRTGRDLPSPQASERVSITARISASVGMST